MLRIQLTKAQDIITMLDGKVQEGIEWGLTTRANVCIFALTRLDVYRTGFGRVNTSGISPKGPPIVKIWLF